MQKGRIGVLEGNAVITNPKQNNQNKPKAHLMEKDLSKSLLNSIFA